MCSLLFKPDWNETKERWRAWWRDEEAGGPLIGISAPRKAPLNIKPTFSPRPPRDNETARTDLEIVMTRTEQACARNASLGARFPYATPSLGPGSMGVYLGATPVFEPATVWYNPCFSNVESAHLVFDRNAKWWRWTLDFLRRGRPIAEGRFLLAMPDLIENLDTLAAVLGTKELLYYLVDAPADIHRLQGELLPLWFEAFDTIYELISKRDGGNSFMAFSVWAPGRMAKLQCDLSAMISPAMFEEFVVPYLKQQCENLYYTLYHLDGPDAVCHIPSLLSIESLHCLQWTPGAGCPDGGSRCWDEIYKTFLDAGRRIHASMAIEKVKPFLRRLGSRGVYICTHATTEEEANLLLSELGAV